MNYFATLAIVLFTYMNFWFIFSLIKKRNDIADVAWGIGFVLIAWTSFFVSEENSFRSILVNILVSIWGIRLFLHIYLRNKGKKEDYRYLAWRKEWGKFFYLRSYFQVYILQGALLFLVIMPVLMINRNIGLPLNFFDIFGLMVWIFGFVFEVVGDWQLSQFVKKPSNKGCLMTTGLWKYTRHPNYFGEIVLWWGVWFMAISVPLGFMAIMGPLTITILILKVSGIPMLEKKMAENPDFIEYKRKTSMLIPWFRKRV